MKWSLLSPGLLIVILLASCQGRKLQQQLEQLSATEIVIPRDIDQMLFGRDTVIIDVGRSPARLMVYIDSLSCSSCRLKYMYEYNDILDLHEELGSEFMPIFVFSPRYEQSAEIRNTLLLYRFDYPILLDEKGLFPAANPHIPADSRLHTFLLDRNGKVVLVGDPVNNPPLWELYKTTITQLIENGGTMPELQE